MSELRVVRIGVAVLLMAAGLGWWIVNIPAAVVSAFVFILGMAIFRWNTLD